MMSIDVTMADAQPLDMTQAWLDALEWDGENAVYTANLPPFGNLILNAGIGSVNFVPTLFENESDPVEVLGELVEDSKPLLFMVDFLKRVMASSNQRRALLNALLEMEQRERGAQDV